jgi:TonB family protein
MRLTHKNLVYQLDLFTSNGGSVLLRMVAMFAPLNDRISRPQSRTLGTSLLLHGLLLGWLLHVPGARVLAPSSVAAGNYGTAVPHLYWPSHSLQANSREHTREPDKLIWHNRHKEKKLVVPDAASPDETQSQSSAPAAPAGLPYGTLATGPAFGDEIRPALPIAATDPIVDPRDLAGHGEGSVIVEVTIDDRGNIVQKVVLQSLGPLIDNKVLAALESWRFRPATRNGVAIPSKQDVYYHFKPNA